MFLFSVTSLAGQTAVPSVSEMLFLIFAWSAIMQPWVILTFFPISAFSPIIAPFMEALSSIFVYGKTTVLVMWTFLPMVTFFPRMAYGPMMEFLPMVTPLSSATGVFVSYFVFLGFWGLVSLSRMILFVCRYSWGLPMSISRG